MKQDEAYKMTEKQEKLTAKKLKGVLWKTLKQLELKKIQPIDADAIATQSREIVRVIKQQQSILRQGNKKITKELLDFAR